MIVTKAEYGLEDAAIEWGRELRDTLWEGSGKPELHAYVNYAHGEESLEQIYGHEGWRLERLKKLKREFDPEGRFRFYVPIAPEPSAGQHDEL